jgi:hypothetical protein
MVIKTKHKRKVRAALALSLALASTGCASGWQAVREDWTPISNRDVSIEKTENSEKIREYNLHARKDFVGEYIAEVDQKLIEEKYQNETLGNIIDTKKVIIEQNTTKFPIFGISGALGGMVLGTLIIPDNGSGSKFIGGMGGLAVGGLGGNFMDKRLLGGGMPMSTETRTRMTNETKKETTNIRSQKSYLGCVTTGEDLARNIAVELDGQGYKTDSFGQINLSDFVESKNPNYFFRDSTMSQNGMISRLKQIPLVKEIKPKTLDRLIKELTEEADPIVLKIRADTKEKGSYNEKVKNSNRIITLNGYELSNEDIHKIVRKFVDAEINTRIVQVKFDVKDIVSRTPISNSTFNYSVNAPTKDSLVEEYFTGSLKDYAKSQIKDYLVGEGDLENFGSSMYLPVYNPALIKLEITHPNYRFVSGNVKVNQDGTNKVVYMADKGDKVRIDQTPDGSGKIE